MYIRVIAYLSNFYLKNYILYVLDHSCIFKMKGNDFYQKSFKQKLCSPKEDVMIKFSRKSIFLEEHWLPPLL